MDLQMGGAQDQTSSQAGGASAGQTIETTQSQQDTSTQRLIKPEDHERAVNDMMKFKKAAQEEAQKRAELEQKLKDFQKKTLEGSSDFKGLWELERQAKEELARQVEEERQKALSLKNMVAYNEKLKAVQKGLLDTGFRKEALSILESESLENVELEITSKGNFNVHGVDTFIESYKKKYGFLFGSNQSSVVNSGGGSTFAEEKPLTHDYIAQLSRSKKPEDLEMLKKLWPKYVQQIKQKK